MGGDGGRVKKKGNIPLPPSKGEFKILC